MVAHPPRAAGIPSRRGGQNRGLRPACGSMFCHHRGSWGIFDRSGDLASRMSSFNHRADHCVRELFFGYPIY